MNDIVRGGGWREDGGCAEDGGWRRRAIELLIYGCLLVCSCQRTPSKRNKKRGKHLGLAERFMAKQTDRENRLHSLYNILFVYITRLRLFHLFFLFTKNLYLFVASYEFLLDYWPTNLSDVKNKLDYPWIRWVPTVTAIHYDIVTSIREIMLDSN